MLDFLNQPLSGTSSLILVAVLAVVIFVAIKLGHKKARDISKQFLTEHPNAATLYLYGEDLPSNSWTVSRARFPRSTIPGRFPAPRCKRAWPAMCCPERWSST